MTFRTGMDMTFCNFEENEAGQAAPAERRGGNTQDLRDRVISQISMGLNIGAIDLHRLELERLGRKALAACQYRAMLLDLKERIARRAALRPAVNVVMAGAGLPSQAA